MKYKYEIHQNEENKLNYNSVYSHAFELEWVIR